MGPNIFEKDPVGVIIRIGGNMIISRRMTRNPVTATPEMSVGEASELMKREKVHRLPVLDKDKNP